MSSLQLEALEKQTLFAIVHAIQQYSAEAKVIFDTTPVPEASEVIVLAEDIVQYALEVAEVYPIDVRFAGFTDYKRVRWMPTTFGLIPQALLVDAKASTENTRSNLQQSQLPMDADFIVNGVQAQLNAGVGPHLRINTQPEPVLAVTTSIFIHFYYRDVQGNAQQLRNLISIFVLCIPHGSLKPIYNPNPATGFWIKGKHSHGRGENPRIRVSFNQLRVACPWRLQNLVYPQGLAGFTRPVWRDLDANGVVIESNFNFIPRPAAV
jgi:hypothetical protein